MNGRVRAANAAWEALLGAHATLNRRFAAEAGWGGLSMREYDVLYTLAKSDGPLRLADLNEHVLLSQPALSRMVDRLAARGLVERSPDPDDRRSVRIGLTDAGAAEQRGAGRPHARGVAPALLETLDADEIAALAALCTKLAGRSAARGDEDAG
ncbi:MAG TPA: MarR family transcriptional regulator [Miltoncostaeaceae bacterium]|nr:MarR family transcriptional regulator [Miltoncostaeaceae bacterium]